MLLITCWSAKGGTGTTVVACALASILASSRPEGCLLVDCAGDVPGALGMPEPDTSGVCGWLDRRASEADEGGALASLEIPAADGLSIIARGPASPFAARGDQVEALATALAADVRAVVVDAGMVDPQHLALLPLVSGATRSLLVSRACFLSLRRAVRLPVRPSGVVLVVEPGRSLRAADVANVIGAPVVAELPLDPAIARAVDSGLLPSRLPRAFSRALGDVA